MPRCLVVALIIFTLTFSALAQSAGPRKATLPDASAEAAARQSQLGRLVASPNASSTCSYTFTTGSGPKYLQSCVTVNGNLTEFQNPQYYEHIRVGLNGEGYGICDITAGYVGYFDYADYGDSANWQAPVTLSSTATSVKIQRTTGDGNWTLTQTLTQSATNSNVKITMVLKNNTSVTRDAYLVRWVDTDAAGWFNNDFGSTYTSVFGYVTNLYGLALQALPPLSSFWTSEASNGYPDPCNWGTAAVATPVNGDYGMFLGYIPFGIKKGASKTITMIYKGM